MGMVTHVVQIAGVVLDHEHVESAQRTLEQPVGAMFRHTVGRLVGCVVTKFGPRLKRRASPETRKYGLTMIPESSFSEC